MNKNLLQCDKIKLKLKHTERNRNFVLLANILLYFNQLQLLFQMLITYFLGATTHESSWLPSTSITILLHSMSSFLIIQSQQHPTHQLQFHQSNTALPCQFFFSHISVYLEYILSFLQVLEEFSFPTKLQIVPPLYALRKSVNRWCVCI